MVVKAMGTLEELVKAGNARNKKLEILKGAKDNNTLKEMFVLAYDWRQTFGVTVKKFTTSKKLHDKEKAWKIFKNFIEKEECKWVSCETLVKNYIK